MLNLQSFQSRAPNTSHWIVRGVETTADFSIWIGQIWKLWCSWKPAQKARSQSRKQLELRYVSNDAVYDNKRELLATCFVWHNANNEWCCVRVCLFVCYHETHSHARLPCNVSTVYEIACEKLEREIRHIAWCECEWQIVSVQHSFEQQKQSKAFGKWQIEKGNYHDSSSSARIRKAQLKLAQRVGRWTKYTRTHTRNAYMMTSADDDAP